jgi:hypothetical protein
MNSDRVKELEEQIAELKRRFPAHSVPPTMLQQLEELEDELESEREKANRGKDSAQTEGRDRLSEMPN